MLEVNCECAATNTDKCRHCMGFKKDDVYPGDMVIYVPSHAMDDDGLPILTHDAVEWGFVTSMNEDFVFCRFFLGHNDLRLRTTANSEACSPQDLYKLQDMPAMATENIRLIMEDLGYEPGKDVGE